MHFNLSEKAPPSGFHIRCNYLYIPQQHSRAHRDLTVSSRRVSLWSRTFPCSQVELCRKDPRPREALPAGRRRRGGGWAGRGCWRGGAPGERRPGLGADRVCSRLRCVREQQRSFALGIQWIVVRILGTVRCEGPVPCACRTGHLAGGRSRGCSGIVAGGLATWEGHHSLAGRWRDLAVSRPFPKAPRGPGVLGNHPARCQRPREETCASRLHP